MPSPSRKLLIATFKDALRAQGVEALDVTITGAGIGFDVKTESEARKVEALLVQTECPNVNSAHDPEFDLWYVVADFPVKK